MKNIYEYLFETYKIHDIKFDLHNVIKSLYNENESMN